jgi:hypothetical protein
MVEFHVTPVNRMAGRPGLNAGNEPGWMKTRCVKKTGLTVRWP